MGKSKILCLHGGGSNNEVTQFQTAGLKLSSRADCHYLHAPHQANRCYPGLQKFVDGPFWTWSEASDSEQWDKSLESIAEYCRKEGPFDAVFGFSQGAAIITQFSYPVIWKERFGFPSCPWKSAILACGGAASNVVNDHQVKIDIPSLHIMGSADPYLAESKALLEWWTAGSARTYTHQKGHEIELLILSREEELGTILNEFLLL
mmetsp:Transcript_28844/g.69685  ORF Transcript_28844/g.69685 Transcript_28844/m.69685 type:complete len:205 (-) Transcript_28844:25-639(-)